MDDYNIIGGNRHNSSYQSLFEGIVLGRMETYDASKLNCWAFRRSTDERDGITLSLGNLCGGYSFPFCGHIFPTSESAYLCGEFSLNTPIHAEIQQALLEEKNGFVSKKFIKSKYKEYIREDWGEIRLQWMLYVVWHKCIGNADFRNLLLSIPDDAVIIEDSTANYGATCMIWGAKNKELRKARRARKKELCAAYPTMKKKDLNLLIAEECGKITDVGCFVGENNMGKILMLCKIALRNNTVPPIDYELLRAKKIYLFGKLLTFDGEDRL